MIKRFRVHTTWFDGYENKEVYYYCLGYKNLGKTLKNCIDNEEEILDIMELVKTFKSFIVCFKKTCSWEKNKCSIF